MEMLRKGYQVALKHFCDAIGKYKDAIIISYKI
jgi:hypothetical protein